MKTFVRNLLILYLVVLLLCWGAIRFDTGSSWWVSLFLFSPRWVLGLPWLLLFPLTLVVHFRLAFLYLIHLAILLFLILDFRVPLANDGNATRTGGQLRLMTCNLGEGPIRVEQLVELVRQYRTQVLVLQECSPSVSHPLFEQLGWKYHQEANLVIGSNLPMGPLDVLSRQAPEAYNAVVAVASEVTLEHPPAAIHGTDAVSPQVARIVSIHLPTFRPAFEKAEAFDSKGGAEFAVLATYYRGLVEQTLTELRSTSQDHSTVVAGDFNVPIESSFYRDYWHPFQNALSQRGVGLCYTKYTRFHGVRIDHVLAERQWQIRTAEVGPDLGGDHRPVIVELQLPN